jgi:hypothetical protein
MLAALKGQWRGLQRSRPGRRFQNRYASAQRKRLQTPAWHHVARVAVAAVMLVAGAIFIFLPGPAILFFAVAGALLAAESLVLAQGLDWTELRLRALRNRAGRRWARLGLAGRVAIVGPGLGAALGALFVIRRFFLD